MARLFISHSSVDNAAALALRDWLAGHGYDDVFLDIDPQRGLVAGQRWQEALKAAADRCEAVLFLVSPAWLRSRWCLAEFLLAKSLNKRIFGLIVAPVPLDEVPAEMTAEWQLCELAGEGRLREFEVELLGRPARVAFREAGLDLLRRGLERAGLDARSFPWPPKDEPDRAPYRGLKAFEPQDAAVFFGRDAWIVRGLDQLRGLAARGVAPMLVILGASGSGKSSFLRAGLWPRLLRDDANFLPLPVVRPQSAVLTGSTGLIAALARAFARLGEPRSPGRLRDSVGGGAVGVAGLLGELSRLAQSRHVALAEPPGDLAIILPLDQAEELFLADGAAEAEPFLDLLTALLAPREGEAPASRLFVVATLRSDRLELLQNEPRLVGVKRELFDLPPIPPTEYKSVIEGPARRVAEAGGRLVIEPALGERLVADAEGIDALPLLGFTLERLYADYAAEGRLTVAEYERLGGVQGSIEAAVAAALAEPERPPAIPAGRGTQLAALRAAFIPFLARIDPDSGAPLRRVARRHELPDEAQALVERLVAARLLVADRRDEVDVVEVAHESLLRQWPTLSAWLGADRDALQLVAGVERATTEWQRNGSGDAWLDHRGERLAAAETLLARPEWRRRLGGGVAYLAACRARDDAERREREEALTREQARLVEIASAQTRTARLQRVVAGALVAVLLAVVAGAGLVLWQVMKNVGLQASLAEQQVALDARDLALADGQVALTAQLAETELSQQHPLSGLRLAVQAARQAASFDRGTAVAALANAELARAVSHTDWWLMLVGHDGAVNSATFSPDGHRIVTASADKTARIWDVPTGRELLALRGHEGSVHSAAFSPDGTRIVTASDDRTARVWDAAGGRQLLALRGHDSVVNSAAFSPDGGRIVTAAWDMTAQVWDAATGRKILTLGPQDHVVISAAFSPDGNRIITSLLEDDTVRVWDATSGRKLVTLSGHEGPVSSIAFSPDGRHVVTGSEDKTAQVWDAATGRRLMSLRGHEGEVYSAVFSPDGGRIVTVSADKTVRLWDAATGRELIKMRAHEGSVWSAAFSPDRSRLVTASRDGSARVWDEASGRERVALRGHERAVSFAAFSPDGRQIVTASGDHTARVWDPVSGQELAALRGHENVVSSATFSPDGTRIFTGSWDWTVRVWDAATGRERLPLHRHEGGVSSIASSPDGREIVIASGDDAVRIWDAVSGRELVALRGHQRRVSSAAFSPDGTHIVTASEDNSVRVWEAATGQEMLTMRGHQEAVSSAAFSPDGKRIVSASKDMTARIWNAATGRELLILRGHEMGVTSAAFGLDGGRIVTGSADGTARIWDAATGRELVTLRGYQSAVNSAAFSPNGERIVTASSDNTARVWDVHFATMVVPDLLVEACTRRLRALSILTRDEMRMLGEPDDKPPIDVCAGVE